MTVVTEESGLIMACGKEPAMTIVMLKSWSPSSNVSSTMGRLVQRVCSVVASGNTISSELPSQTVSSAKTVERESFSFVECLCPLSCFAR